MSWADEKGGAEEKEGEEEEFGKRAPVKKTSPREPTRQERERSTTRRTFLSGIGAVTA